MFAQASTWRRAPGLHIARGSSSSGAVAVEVRRVSAAIGFAGLEDGEIVAEDSMDAPTIYVPFQVVHGGRYLVLAMPVVDGAPDRAHAHAVEVLP